MVPFRDFSSAQITLLYFEMIIRVQGGFCSKVTASIQTNILLVDTLIGGPIRIVLSLQACESWVAVMSMPSLVSGFFNLLLPSPVTLLHHFIVFVSGGDNWVKLELNLYFTSDLFILLSWRIQWNVGATQWELDEKLPNKMKLAAVGNQILLHW